MGRSCGGILVGTKKHIKIKTSQKQPNQISITIPDSLNSQKLLTLTFMYINPTCDPAKAIEQSCHDNNHDISTLFLGDFNCRIGTHNSDIPLIPNLTRSSKDLTVNSKGRKFLDICTENDLIILNGRTPGDEDGNYTHISTNGSSVLDLAICNATMLKQIKELNILHWHHSDHFPIQIKTIENHPIHKQPNRSYNCIKWTESKRKIFQKKLHESVEDNKPKDLQQFSTQITKVAEDLQLIQKKFFTQPLTRSPWNNEDIKATKKQIRSALTKIKTSQAITETVKSNYLQLKYSYNKMTRDAKKKYYHGLQNQITTAKTPNDFWTALQTFRNKKAPITDKEITKKEWSQHFSSIYKSEGTPSYNQPDNKIQIDELDKPFTLSELNTVLHSLKNKKASGKDGIPNEVWKSLTLFNKSLLLSILNNIYESANIPKEWTEVLITPIYKKQDPTKPQNYRPISLLNNSLKIFTQLLCNRLIAWCEKNNKLSNFQFAYRKGMGCEDAVFVLHSIITKRVKLDKKRLYSTFIDLSQAFDSIEHTMLWEKMKQKSISSKFIQICQKIYENASAEVKTPTGFTKHIKIEKGVLQGETLSPILFIIFMDDTISCLNNSSTLPIRMGATKIHIILYADDQILLAPTAQELQEKMNVLEHFFLENNLKVNTTKTKVVIFENREHKRRYQFKWGPNELEIVKNYTYLGVPLNHTLNNNFSSKHFITQGKLAITNLLNLTWKAKIYKISQIFQLYYALVRSVVSYCAPIWGINNIEIFETLETNFLRRILRVPNITPRWFLHLETNIKRAKTTFYKQLLQFWKRILTKPANHPTRICYEVLKNCHNEDKNKKNWVTQLAGHLATLKMTRAWKEQRINQKDIHNHTKTLNTQLILADIETSKNSKKIPHYKHIHKQSTIQYYLDSNLPWKTKHFITHVRLGYSHFLFNGSVTRLNTLEYLYNKTNTPNCQTCNKHEKETLYHLIISCPHYNNCRAPDLINLIRNTEETNLAEFMHRNFSYKMWKTAYSCFQTILRTRAFLNEY